MSDKDTGKTRLAAQSPPTRPNTSIGPAPGQRTGGWSLAAETLSLAAWLGGGLGIAVTCATFLVAEVAVIGSVTSTPIKWDNVGTIAAWIVIAIPFCSVLVHVITRCSGQSRSASVRVERQGLDAAKPITAEDHPKKSAVRQDAKTPLDPRTIAVSIGWLAIFVGLVVGSIFAGYAFAFSSIENRAPIENIGIGLFSLGVFLAGLQIVAGVGLTLHRSLAGKLAQPAGLGVTIVALLSWVPVFARGASMIGLGVVTVLVIGSVVALRFVPITGGDKKQSVDGS